MSRVERILFIGDSLIAFYDWQEYFPKFACVNLGVPGETVAGWLGLTAQAGRRYPEAEYLVVMLGANNICQQDYGFFADYGILLDELRCLYPEAQIIVCSLLPHELPWLAGTAISRLNESLEILARERGDLFLDLYTPFVAQGGGCFMEDGVHLAEMGYRIWSDMLTTVFAGRGVDGIPSSPGT